MGELTTGDVADLVGGDFLGDRSRRIERVATLAEAGPEDLSFLGNARYDGLVETSKAGAILVSKDLESDSDRYVRVSNPYVALAKVLSRWFDSDVHPRGVSDLSFVAPDARLGTGVGIGAFAVIGAGATIGDGAIIYDGVSIGADVEIGEGTIIYARAAIYAGTKIGRRCVIHSGAVIGSDGYGFANDEGRHVKIPQLGIVRIEDDVEIGACTTIDRGALGETVIGEGSKLDNLVQVAHGVKIGKHTLLVSQSGVAGSTEIGAHCILAGQAGTYGHIKLGDGVVLTARAVATKDWEGPVQLAGFPGTPLKEKLRADAMVGRLPKTIETVKRLEQRVSELERRLEDDSSQESE